MNLQSINIVFITKARRRLARFQKVISKLYQKAFLNSQLLSFTREFSEKEMAEWKKEDRL